MHAKVSLVTSIVAITWSSCTVSENNPSSGRDGWLKGSPHEKLDVVAGGITMFSGSPGEAKSLADSGRVRILALMADKFGEGE